MYYLIEGIACFIAGGVVVRLFYAKAIAAAKAGLTNVASKL